MIGMFLAMQCIWVSSFYSKNFLMSFRFGSCWLVLCLLNWRINDWCHIDDKWLVSYWEASLNQLVLRTLLIHFFNAFVFHFQRVWVCKIRGKNNYISSTLDLLYLVLMTTFLWWCWIFWWCKEMWFLLSIPNNFWYCFILDFVTMTWFYLFC